MEWNETIIGELKALWAEGLSTAEIGRRLGISKNAVVGKAHRLDLSPRPSPIRRTDRPQGAQAPAPRVTGPTLAPLPSGPQTIAAPTAPAATTVSPVAIKPVAPRRLAAVAPAAVARVSACCWPVGEPGKPGFHFCDGAAVAGKPYCAEHAQLAYVKIRDRREDAA
ncbi:GcrA family cell cycle regulator [Acidisoma silvae]|uniref:GcrA cell cycle regulator n=1 Tax=Acidisoma silvae TaxID=2802396 RepID=A0A963YPH7_9PROT|nr:GcrA family cell cycle regulator [Acidisoma silvae]MCB8873860.1 GcrA cell cycle regulator [Acidisoma silvae]